MRLKWVGPELLMLGGVAGVHAVCKPLFRSKAKRTTRGRRTEFASFLAWVDVEIVLTEERISPDFTVWKSGRLSARWVNKFSYQCRKQTGAAPITPTQMTTVGCLTDGTGCAALLQKPRCAVDPPCRCRSIQMTWILSL